MVGEDFPSIRSFFFGFYPLAMESYFLCLWLAMLRHTCTGRCIKIIQHEWRLEKADITGILALGNGGRLSNYP